MCTAICFDKGDGYFGRNLDYYCDFGQTVTMTPRNFNIKMQFLPHLKNHYAIIGIAAGGGEYPLYFDAANEKGLCMAGLNFPQNAYYFKKGEHGKTNLAPFELIPYILGRCSDVAQAQKLLSKINIVDISFSPHLKNTPLHWLISDRSTSLTVEPMKSGLVVHQNPMGLLTNNPPFETQLLLLQNYMQLSPTMPKNNFGFDFNGAPYSLGMGAIGLPGDLSSASRFVRAAFGKLNIRTSGGEGAFVEDFFHLLKSVAQIKGLALTDGGEMEHTMYSCCINMSKGIYYYTTYGNSRITAVSMQGEILEGERLINYPLRMKFDPIFDNKV